MASSTEALCPKTHEHGKKMQKAGNFTDQTIEQVLMQMLKTHGGLKHGRGITRSTRAKMIHVLPNTSCM